MGHIFFLFKHAYTTSLGQTKFFLHKCNYKDQRCQLLRITRNHYGKLRKFSVFYGLWKTRIFLREFFKKVVMRNVAKKSLHKRIWFSMAYNFRDRLCFRVTAMFSVHNSKSMDQGCHSTWKTGKSQGISFSHLSGIPDILLQVYKRF